MPKTKKMATTGIGTENSAAEVECREWFDDSDFSNHRECTWRNASMEQVYIEETPPDSDHLLSSLPTQDTTYCKYEDSGVQYLEVTYTYIDKNHLRYEVEWVQSSGSSVYEILEKEGVITFKRTDYLP